jgi:hypothetical protein
MTALEQFENTVHGPWETSGVDVQYRVELDSDVVRVYFQCTKTWRDWLYDFWFTPERGGSFYGKYRVHAGYLRAFESVARDVIQRIIETMPSDSHGRIQIFGYSYGGAMATLLHLFLKMYWGGVTIQTWTFGSPRTLWGEIGPKIERLFDGLTNFKASGDLVTHYMPRFTGYRDVGLTVMVGEPRKLPSFKAHVTRNYRKALEGVILGIVGVRA